MLYCNTCEQAWERFWINNVHRFIKYKDMPTYGLERKQCFGCSEGKLYECV